MNMSQLSVKVYHVENKATKEIRKFSVDGEVAESFEYLVGKIRQVFPDLLRKDLELFWKDDEDDFISVSSDEELSQAINGMPTSAGCLKIYVKVKKESQPQSSEEHPGVTCDGCDTNINGIRYKCSVCFDYDLCSSCESKDLHPEDHELLCIKKPRTSASIYVMRPPFGRGCHGGPRGGRGGPWGFGGRGRPWGRGPWCGMRRSDHCGKSRDSKKTEGNISNEKAQGEEEEEPYTAIRCVAAELGLDPDVVESQAKLFFDNLSKESQPESDSVKTDDRENKTGADSSDTGLLSFIRSIATGFGLEPDVVENQTKLLFGDLLKQHQLEGEKVQTKDNKSKEDNQPEGEKVQTKDKKTKEDNQSDDEEITITKNVPANSGDSKEDSESKSDENMETDSDKPHVPEPQNVNFNQMVNEFSRQFGLNPEIQHQAESAPFANLGEVMGKIFGNFAVPPEPKASTGANETSSNDSTEEHAAQKGEDFIVVDRKPAEENLTEEQKYEQRLEKAIKQMEAMGFDNDGGWLRQLLISKDLSIGKVLDALNPSN